MSANQIAIYKLNNTDEVAYGEIRVLTVEAGEMSDNQVATDKHGDIDEVSDEEISEEAGKIHANQISTHKLKNTDKVASGEIRVLTVEAGEMSDNKIATDKHGGIGEAAPEEMSEEAGNISANQIATDKPCDIDEISEAAGKMTANHIYFNKPGVNDEVADDEVSSEEDDELIDVTFNDADENSSDDGDKTALNYRAFKNSVVAFLVENKRDTMELIDALQNFDRALRQALDNFKDSLFVCQKSVDVLLSLEQEGNMVSDNIGSVSCSLVRSLQQCFSMMSNCVTVLSRLRFDAQDNYNEFMQNSLDVLKAFQ